MRTQCELDFRIYEDVFKKCLYGGKVFILKPDCLRVEPLRSLNARKEKLKNEGR